MAEAALVRSVFAAHDIEVVIGGENHHRVIGGLLGPLISLDIIVDESQAEDAAALLQDIRTEGRETTDADVEAAAREVASGPAGAADDGEPDRWPGSERAGASISELDARRAADDDDEPVGMLVDRRRSTGIVLLLGCCITFGTAHMFTRAWLRGVWFAALEVVGFVQLTSDRHVGALLIVTAVVCDVIGAMWRVWSAPGSVVPTARIHR